MCTQFTSDCSNSGSQAKIALLSPLRQLANFPSELNDLVA